MNVVELAGRVTQPVELKETSNGTAVTTINLAVKPDFVKKEEEPKPEFIPVTVWSKLAEVCADHLCKGYLVGVTGRLQRRSIRQSTIEETLSNRLLCAKQTRAVANDMQQPWLTYVLIAE